VATWFVLKKRSISRRVNQADDYALPGCLLETIRCFLVLLSPAAGQWRHSGNFSAVAGLSLERIALSRKDGESEANKESNE
jgi:hypothetical protein